MCILPTYRRLHECFIGRSRDRLATATNGTVPGTSPAPQQPRKQREDQGHQITLLGRRHSINYMLINGLQAASCMSWCDDVCTGGSLQAPCVIRLGSLPCQLGGDCSHLRVASFASRGGQRGGGKMKSSSVIKDIHGRGNDWGKGRGELDQCVIHHVLLMGPLNGNYVSYSENCSPEGRGRKTDQ